MVARGRGWSGQGSTAVCLSAEGVATCKAATTSCSVVAYKTAATEPSEAARNAIENFRIVLLKF